MKDLELLKQLTDLPGGSGDEGLVRDFLRERINKVTKAETDSIGNIYGRIGRGPTVLAVGHMDEIGFKVAGISKDGSLKLHNAGFIFPEGVLCNVYLVVTNSGKIVKGLIGLPLDQRKGMPTEFPSVGSISLDIGCENKEQVEALGIEIGNSVIPESHFEKLENNLLSAKAWDNRIGCAISLRVMEDLAKEDLKVTYIGGGTVQEEVGCRGARALVINTRPDIGFSLDTAPASDEEGSLLGKGPQLFVMDSSTIANKKLLEFVKKVAKDNNIPYQLSLLRRGGTDAGEMQNISGGAPSLAIGVPVRYIHTPISTINYSDYENTIKLLEAVLKAFDEEKVREIKNF